jgi:pyruvate/2-oxoglutarate dehydrogenase complex dihydrolipoamide acyltransferase (E2) component
MCPGVQSEDAYKIGDFAGAVTMLVEAQDEGHLARILVPEGERVVVGTPVALMCEDAGDLAAIQGFEGDVSSDEGKDARRTLTWQAYLKSGTGKGEGCL